MKKDVYCGNLRQKLYIAEND